MEWPPGSTGPYGAKTFPALHPDPPALRAGQGGGPRTPLVGRRNLKKGLEQMQLDADNTVPTVRSAPRGLSHITCSRLGGIPSGASRHSGPEGCRGPRHTQRVGREEERGKKPRGRKIRRKGGAYTRGRRRPTASQGASGTVPEPKVTCFPLSTIQDSAAGPPCPSAPNSPADCRLCKCWVSLLESPPSPKATAV